MVYLISSWTLKSTWSLACYRKMDWITLHYEKNRSFFISLIWDFDWTNAYTNKYSSSSYRMLELREVDLIAHHMVIWRLQTPFLGQRVSWKAIRGDLSVFNPSVGMIVSRWIEQTSSFTSIDYINSSNLIRFYDVLNDTYSFTTKRQYL